MKYNKLWKIGFLACKNSGFNPLLLLLAGQKKKKRRWVKHLVAFKWISLMLLLRNSLESLLMCWSLDVTACLGVLDTKWLVDFLFACSNSMLDVKQKLRLTHYFLPF
jgi:hypothetical protein